MKAIRWSKHAVESLADREIPRIEVERALTHPDAVSPAGFSRMFLMRRYFDPRLGKEMLIRALVKETAQEMTVIPVYITSKIGKYMREIAP